MLVSSTSGRKLKYDYYILKNSNCIYNEYVFLMIGG